MASCPQFITPARTPDINPDENTARQCKKQRQIQGCTGNGYSKPRKKFMHERQPAGFIEHSRLRRHLPGFDQDIDQQINHDGRSYEVEHDGRDNNMTASISLQPSWNKGPGCTEQTRGKNTNGYQ